MKHEVMSETMMKILAMSAVAGLLLFATVLPALGQSITGADASRQHLLLIKLPSGITLNYVAQGDTKGKPIVLLHGAGDSWHSYELVLPLLPASYRVYAITLRGHGWSDHPAEGFARKDFAADITAFLQQLDLKDVVLVGHSLGSFVAQQVAADDKGRLAKLVLIGSGPGTVHDPQVRQSIVSTFEQLRDPIDYTFARDFQASTIYAPVPPAFFETMVAEALKAPANTWHGIGGGFQLPEDPTLLTRIRVPALVFWGDHDEIFSRADQDNLVARIPHAKLTVYADTGHALHWERPERFSADLLKFIAE